MVRLLKRFCWVWLALAGAQCASAFSLLGPIGNGGGTGGTGGTGGDSYQAAALGYNFTGSGDVGAPKNLGEEYRWTIPTLYYAYDQKFLDYFGSNGVYAVDQAFAILNGLFNFTNADGSVITNVDGYSSGLSEFPTETRKVNYRAQALYLWDLKSAALNLVLEELGLASPSRWTWALRYRGGSTAYWVIQRNFDPVTFEPSSYVNDTLYTYVVEEFTSPSTYGDAVEVAADPYAPTAGAVASGWGPYGGIGVGVFYLGLTRDDVGGLRYLWRTNNMNVANSGTNVLQFITNNAPQLVVSTNLALLVAQSLTNDPTTLAATFPGLVTATLTSNFVFSVSTNVVAFYTNYPWAPANSAATLVLLTNIVTNVTMQFQHSFANVVTNTYFTNGTATVWTTNIAPITSPWGPAGTNALFTNIYATTVSNILTGDFYIIPTNMCGFTVVSNLPVSNVYYLTNVLATATNAPGVTNVSGQSFSQSVLYGFTNHYFAVLMQPCATNANTVALRQGMGRIQFVRRDYDSLLNGFFVPVTNYYTQVAVTNNTPVVQTFERIVTNADIVITAQDLSTPPANDNPVLRSNPNFDQSHILSGLAGPGTIAPPFSILFNKIGPVYFNTTTNGDISGPPSSTYFGQWGSFDGTTNEPVVYPSGSSIANMENQVLMDIAPVVLPPSENNQPYDVQFSGIGGQPPYQWTISPVTPTGLLPGWAAGLPPGLSLSPDGTLAGTPTNAGTFAFIVRMTDFGSRYVDRGRVITNSP
jgi:hypothetical protein